MDIEALPAPATPISRTPSGLSAETKRALFQKVGESPGTTTSTITPEPLPVPSPTESENSRQSVVVGARPSLPNQAIPLDAYIENKPGDCETAAKVDQLPEEPLPPSEAFVNFESHA